MLNKVQKAIVRGYKKAFDTWPNGSDLFIAVGVYKSVRFHGQMGVAIYSDFTPIDPTKPAPAHHRVLGLYSTPKIAEGKAEEIRKALVVAGIPDDRVSTLPTRKTVL